MLIITKWFTMLSLFYAYSYELALEKFEHEDGKHKCCYNNKQNTLGAC